jgi:hypothetical protein
MPSVFIVELHVTVHIKVLSVPLLSTKPNVFVLCEVPEKVVPLQTNLEFLKRFS